MTEPGITPSPQPTASDLTSLTLDPRPLDPRPLDPVALYASGIDASDYVERIGPLLRRGLKACTGTEAPGSLLDIGAGGGQLGGMLRQAGTVWTAIEPAPVMIARLHALPVPPASVIAAGWESAQLQQHAFDCVLAANMPAPLQKARAFLGRCRAWSRRSIAWVVPAQAGPRGMCLAGCLPAEWHGEDETPGIDIVMAALGPSDQPGFREEVDWTFSLPVSGLEQADATPAQAVDAQANSTAGYALRDVVSHLAGRLGWDGGDSRRHELWKRLAGLAEATPHGHRLNVPRRSAILVWGQI